MLSKLLLLLFFLAQTVAKLRAFEARPLKKLLLRNVYPTRLHCSVYYPLVEQEQQLRSLWLSAVSSKSTELGLDKPYRNKKLRLPFEDCVDTAYVHMYIYVHCVP